MTDDAATTALNLAITDIDRHLAATWDHPTRLYALVYTRDLLDTEPDVARHLGIDDVVDTAALTPVEQEPMPAGQALDEWLGSIGWPPEVAGCALLQEVVALPPSVEHDVPIDLDVDAAAWAATHPLRREVRMLVGVLRDGSRACLLRVRGLPASTDINGESAAHNARTNTANDADADSADRADSAEDAEDADDVMHGPDLVPHLADALAATLAD